MASPYTSQSSSGYNSSAPADDGSAVASNQVLWSSVKTKLGDPVKTLADNINSALVTAFGKMLDGGSVATTAVDYTVLSADQGKLIRVTAGGKTITTPDATSVSSPFVFAVLNSAASGNTTIDGSGAQTVNGAATVTLPAGQGSIVFTDGSNWFVIGSVLTTADMTLNSLTLTTGLISVYATLTKPTVQRFTSGTAATYTKPANVQWIRVKMVGGGGGGAAKATNAGTDGGTSSFESWTAIKGAGGAVGVNGGGAGGTGGATGTGTLVNRFSGQKGGTGMANGANAATGGDGGNSVYGGAGVGGNGAVAGAAAAANTGSGGSGGGDSGGNSSSGGGAGEYVEFIITAPGATYTYTVGAAGTGGAAGTNAGGNGAAGLIVVEEYYG